MSPARPAPTACLCQTLALRKPAPMGTGVKQNGRDNQANMPHKYHAPRGPEGSRYFGLILRGGAALTALLAMRSIPSLLVVFCYGAR